MVSDHLLRSRVPGMWSVVGRTHTYRDAVSRHTRSAQRGPAWDAAGVLTSSARWGSHRPGTQPHTECQKPDCRLISGILPVLVPVQMTIDCTETVLYACLRRTISLWHHQALLVNMHRTYQVLRSDVLLAAWRTSCSSILGMGSWSTCSLGFTVIL